LALGHGNSSFTFEVPQINFVRLVYFADHRLN
jgi:hypothetical protein